MTVKFITLTINIEILHSLLKNLRIVLQRSITINILCFTDFIPFIYFSLADIISCVEFNHDGNLLATGDKGGRVVIFQRDPMVSHTIISYLRNLLGYAFRL